MIYSDLSGIPPGAFPASDAMAFIEAIAMPAAIGLVVGLIAKTLLRTLAALGVLGLVLLIGLALAGKTHIDGQTLQDVQNFLPAARHLAITGWEHARISPPLIMGACLGVAMRIVSRPRS